MNAVLLNLFDTRSSLMNLLKTMIDNEIQKTGTVPRIKHLRGKDSRLRQTATLRCSAVIRRVPVSSLPLRGCMATTTSGRSSFLLSSS